MGRSASGLSPALLSLLLSLSLYSPFVPSHLFSKFLLHLLYVPFLSFCFISIIIIIVCFLSLSSTLPHLFYAPFILSRLFFPSFVSLPIFSTFISSCLFPLSIYRFYKLLFVLFSFCFFMACCLAVLHFLSSTFLDFFLLLACAFSQFIPSCLFSSPSFCFQFIYFSLPHMFCPSCFLYFMPYFILTHFFLSPTLSYHSFFVSLFSFSCLSIYLCIR